jgi:chromosome segregation ATPase
LNQSQQPQYYLREPLNQPSQYNFGDPLTSQPQYYHGDPQIQQPQYFVRDQIKRTDGLENLVLAQHQEISKLKGLQDQNQQLRENLSRISDRCFVLEERASWFERENSKIKPLQSQRDSLQQNCDLLKENVSRLSAAMNQQAEELAETSPLRTENFTLKSTVKALESKINYLENLLRNQNAGQNVPNNAAAFNPDASKRLQAVASRAPQAAPAEVGESNRNLWV